ncbi:MAG TPA: 2-oxoglutarate dehydrogenase complex dihydrolipoyllysine-residue succinyltransferase [Candidatus Binatia bacterium]
MPIELKVPEVGESISEVEIGEWLKKEGDFVARDDEVVVIETDKATVEISAPESGTITKILKPSGQTASVHEVIAYLEAGEPRREHGASVASAPEPRPGAAKQESAASAPSSRPRAEQGDDRRMIRPSAVSARRVAPAPSDRMSQPSEPKPDPDQVADAVAEAGTETIPEAEALPQVAPRLAEVEKSPRAPARQQGVADHSDRQTWTHSADASEKMRVPSQSSDDNREQIVSMSHLRRRIAERLLGAQHNAALLTTFNEVEMTSVIELRRRYRDVFQERYQTKLGFMSFFVKASIAALTMIPEVNAEIRGTDIVFRKFFDIGVAVGGGKGLVVPVLRNADRLTFADIERAIADFASRAEQSKILPAELQGGTFTISNGGIYGSLLSTPIVNPPQSGILGLHAIQDRPVVRDSAIVIRPMMYLALTYDHRLIDGREAVRFLKHIKEMIEDPARLLLDI